MNSRRTILAILAVLASLARNGSADVWDSGGTSAGDNTRGTTRNELMHGSVQSHDLAAISGSADEDWYRISIKPYTSYEVVVDGTSVNVGPPIVLELTDAAGTSLQTSVGVSSGGYSRSLRFYNDTGTLIDNRYVHVKSGGCTTACTANDVYRIRLFDTSLGLSRFNNVPTPGEPEPYKETYVILQNPTDYTIHARIFYFSQAGSCLCRSPLMTLTKRATAVIDPDGVGGSVNCYGGACSVCESDGGLDACGDISDIEGLSGHAIVVSDARFGDLSGKGSDLDPSGTLWEFSTEMPARGY